MELTELFNEILLLNGRINWWDFKLCFELVTNRYTSTFYRFQRELREMSSTQHKPFLDIPAKLIKLSE